MLVIVALRKLRQGDHRFEDNLDSEKKKRVKIHWTQTSSRGQQKEQAQACTITTDLKQ